MKSNTTKLFVVAIGVACLLLAAGFIGFQYYFGRIGSQELVVLPDTAPLPPLVRFEKALITDRAVRSGLASIRCAETVLSGGSYIEWSPDSKEFVSGNCKYWRYVVDEIGEKQYYLGGDTNSLIWAGYDAGGRLLIYRAYDDGLSMLRNGVVVPGPKGGFREHREDEYCGVEDFAAFGDYVYIADGASILRVVMSQFDQRVDRILRRAGELGEFEGNPVFNWVRHINCLPSGNLLVCYGDGLVRLMDADLNILREVRMLTKETILNHDVKGWVLSNGLLVYFSVGSGIIYTYDWSSGEAYELEFDDLCDVECDGVRYAWVSKSGRSKSGVTWTVPGGIVYGIDLLTRECFVELGLVAPKLGSASVRVSPNREMLAYAIDKRTQGTTVGVVRIQEVIRRHERK